MERSVENKVVVITGAGTGLGLQMAKKFVENCAKVVLVIDFDEKLGVDAVNGLNEKHGPGKAVFIKCDITTDLDETYEKIINDYKTVDVLINNAGILNEKSIRKTIEVNTIALMEWTSKFYDFMRKDRCGRGGTIINVSSIFGFRILAFNPAYHASKFAVIGYSKSMGHEYNYEKTGVRVVVLCPGLTHTNLAGNPNARDDESFDDLIRELKTIEWQEEEAIGRGVMEIFEQADSGTIWLVEGSRSAVMI